jgi:hypothetical protein
MPPDREELLTVLDESDVDRYLEVRADPEGLLDAVRAEPDFGRRLVMADSLLVLRQWFSRGEPEWVDDPERSGLLGDHSVGAAWEFSGVHDRPEVFNGLPASGRDVTVRGFTIIGPPDRDENCFRHYVDWAGLYAQLGLSLNWRIPLLTDPLPVVGADQRDDDRPHPRPLAWLARKVRWWRPRATGSPAALSSTRSGGVVSR